MHVPQHAPVTWRNRSVESRLAHLDLGGRAHALYLQLTAGAGVFAALRRLPALLRTRLLKARSATQTPSAYQRHAEELVALHGVGVPLHQLRLSAVDLTLLITDLDDRPVTATLVLEAIAIGDGTEAAEQLAESRLLTRGDRGLAEGDLEALEDATRADIAADTEKLTRCRRLRLALRASRQAHASRPRRHLA